MQVLINEKKIAISFVLLISLSTITVQQKISITNFNLKKIEIENNSLLKDKRNQKTVNSDLQQEPYITNQQRNSKGNYGE